MHAGPHSNSIVKVKDLHNWLGACHCEGNVRSLYQHYQNFYNKAWNLRQMGDKGGLNFESLQ